MDPYSEFFLLLVHPRSKQYWFLLEAFTLNYFPCRTVVALAGNDGVVIVWELMGPEVPNLHDRNYIKEINYFHPGRKNFMGEAAQEFDVSSIESIMATQSDSEGEGAFGANEDGDEDEAEQDVL